MGNYHPQYMKWCLAVWFIKYCPRDIRKQDNVDRRISDKQLRLGWLMRYEKRRGGEDLEFRDMAMKIHKSIASGQEPVYDGPFKEEVG